MPRDMPPGNMTDGDSALLDEFCDHLCSRTACPRKRSRRTAGSHPVRRLDGARALAPALIDPREGTCGILRIRTPGPCGARARGAAFQPQPYSSSPCAKTARSDRRSRDAPNKRAFFQTAPEADGEALLAARMRYPPGPGDAPCWRCFTHGVRVSSWWRETIEINPTWAWCAGSAKAAREHCGPMGEEGRHGSRAQRKERQALPGGRSPTRRSSLRRVGDERQAFWYMIRKHARAAVPGKARSPHTLRNALHPPAQQRATSRGADAARPRDISTTQI